MIWVIGILYNAIMHNMEFGQAYCKDFLKGIQRNLFFIFRSFTLFLMIFRSFTHFLRIYLFIFEILEKEKRFLAREPASGPQATASRAHSLLSAAGRLGHGLGAWPTSRPGQLWLWRAASTQSAVIVAAAGAAAWPVVARRWPRWEEVAGTSNRGPQSMRHARRGVMGLTEVAQHR
jgi:hypothetical protein